MDAIIRDYKLGDSASAYHVCMKTGDYGKDGEPFFREDPDALGRIYVGPYLEYAPEFALMLEDANGICGYALAVLDSRQFFDRYENEWRPGLCEKFSDPPGVEAAWTRVQSVHHLYHHPDYFCPEPYEHYPSHLHIDLLPHAHRRGFGRRMIEELLDRLRNRNSPGVHLGMSARNDDAFHFYVALGFEELIRNDQDIYLGIRFR